MRILKYEPDATGHIWMPEQARVRKIALQNDVPKIWAETDDRDLGQVAYRIVPTGGTVDETGDNYVDTLVGDKLVWHVYRAFSD